MSLARAKAEQILRKHRVYRPFSLLSLDCVLWCEGITVCDFPRSMPVREFRVGNVIGVRSDLDAAWRLWETAHGLGHFLLHAGDQTDGAGSLDNRRQERQADEFAGWLLVGRRGLLLPPWEAAESYGVPEEKLRTWLTIVGARFSSMRRDA